MNFQQIETIKRRFKAVFKVAFMPPSSIAYVNLLKESSEFDSAFYLRTNSNINSIYHRFPERHYVLYGESLGLRPNPDFAPKDYLRLNKDIGPEHKQALRHFLASGKKDGRATAVRPGTSSGAKSAVVRPLVDGQKAEFAIVIHVYYHDLWEGFKERLLDLDIDFDLFVTATFDANDTDNMFADIRDTFPNSRCFELHNHGRDIFPFVYLANSGVLDGYSAICKFHTKKSPHRTDGEQWRDHLISGLLDGPNTSRITDAFLADNTAAFLVADGQHFKETRWWGSNFERTKELLSRVEVPITFKGISFPAGSIYWLKPEILAMIKGLRLTEDDFEFELGQVDGTLAHAFERGIGFLATNGGQETRQTTEILTQKDQDDLPVPAYTSCFYLPQFHPTEMNDKWWGKGFTEWASCVSAKPQYKGHQQPVLPSDLGFYDLRLPSVMGQQAEMAKNAGIDAFCVYHYWFDRTRILEEPMNNLLSNPEIDFPFYLCWANESWRRNWDGLTGEVLLDQSYKDGFEENLVEDSLVYMRDPRYQRPNGRDPRFMIYRPEDMPKPAENVARMRQAWRDAGIGEVELGAVRFHVAGDHPVAEGLFDFWVEMPPHGLVVEKDVLNIDTIDPDYTGNFSGLIYSYDGVIENSTRSSYVKSLPKKTIAGVMPCWDNTARRGEGAHMAIGANPQSFNRWLRSTRANRLKGSYQNELFINAWNEWAENAILEPSLHYGSAYLEVVKKNLSNG